LEPSFPIILKLLFSPAAAFHTQHGGGGGTFHPLTVLALTSSSVHIAPLWQSMPRCIRQVEKKNSKDFGLKNLWLVTCTDHVTGMQTSKCCYLFKKSCMQHMNLFMQHMNLFGLGLESSKINAATPAPCMHGKPWEV
jgi:hypothetical protein